MRGARIPALAHFRRIARSGKVDDVTSFVGTSGYSYAEWKGSFYPAKMRSADMLGFYAEHFSTVELNHTFYRMPDKDAVARWAEAVPRHFRFIVKAPRQITHNKRLRECAEVVGELGRRLEPLEDKLGAVLFQLPPNFRADRERLGAFLADVPNAWRSVFEFRHDSWNDEAIEACLAARGATLCVAETQGHPPSEAAAGQRPALGYVRLRGGGYTDADLAAWAKFVKDGHDEAYVLFKHDDGAPALAKAFLRALETPQ